MTEEQLDEAIARASKLGNEPKLTEATYNRELDCIVLRISDGRRLILPRENIEGLEAATPEEAADIEISAQRVSLRWPCLDVDHYLPAFLEGRYGSDLWMDHVNRREASNKSVAA